MRPRHLAGLALFLSGLIAIHGRLVTWAKRCPPNARRVGQSGRPFWPARPERWFAPCALPASAAARGVRPISTTAKMSACLTAAPPPFGSGSALVNAAGEASRTRSTLSLGPDVRPPAFPIANCPAAPDPATRPRSWPAPALQHGSHRRPRISAINQRGKQTIRVRHNGRRSSSAR